MTFLSVRKGSEKMLKRISYDRLAAVKYAERWAFVRNPRYYSFEGIGGNCTNFVSQCVYAGCGVMNYTPVFGWYYIDANNRTPSWTGVEYFYDFMTQNMSQGPFAIESDLKYARPGDVLQLGDAEGDFYHTLLVMAVTNKDIYIAANSNDALYRPLSTYNYYNVRCLHIMGAFVETEI